MQTEPVAKSTRLTTSMQSFFNNVSQYFGTRYRSGGQTPKGFDCSGFVRFMYDKVFNMHLPRSSKEMSVIGNKVSKNDLQPGDLVFFQTRNQRINHVGIFIGNDTFVHSSLSKGITEDQLKVDYFEKRFAGAVRLLDPSTDKLPPLPLQQQETGNDITKPS
ncbi:MAG: C40 family peptidase [Chlorobium sp.]